MTETKSFGAALALWFFFGGFGAHRAYVKEDVWVLFYYWLGTIVTFGLLPLIDVFFIKRMIREANEKSIRERHEFEKSLN